MKKTFAVADHQHPRGAAGGVELKHEIYVLNISKGAPKVLHGPL